MKLLIIKLTSPDAPPLVASIGDKITEDNFVSSDWATVRSKQRGQKVVLLIPDNEVSLAETIIPSKNKKQMLQALPFALEESLAEDVEKLHFSALRESDDLPVKAAIINHERLGFWIDLLKEHDINVHYILPAMFALPVASEGWSVAVTENEAQVRQGMFSGFACDLDVLDYVLPSQLEEHSPQVIDVSGDSLRMTRLLQGQDIEIRAGNAPSLIQLKDLQPTLPLSLLNNYNRGESALKSINWSPWKPVGVIAGLLLATWLGMFMWHNHQSEQKLTAIESEITKVYRSAVANGSLTDADAQLSSMRSLRRQLEGNPDSANKSPLPIIARLAPQLKRFPKMEIQEVAFKQNKIELKVEAPNLGMLDQFKQTAEKAQLSVSIRSSKTTADSVASTLVIEETAE
ncbi:type II secretion system protein GspL [Leucothrix arctica]|uniref:Type II secretion system protein L n=1 Tax=Leucothrix arctica TaxID=1481894 RepID=A0A317C7K6_9GAMM|nr:type II secretion system protein GspL [Leucothrix arctica]PWQ94615.1 hypothetical protein DKT75_15075 [Leucothrix arctica]